jgi:hypothetical protein
MSGIPCQQEVTVGAIWGFKLDTIKHDLQQGLGKGMAVLKQGPVIVLYT